LLRQNLAGDLIVLRVYKVAHFLIMPYMESHEKRVPANFDLTYVDALAPPRGHYQNYELKESGRDSEKGEKRGDQ